MVTVPCPVPVTSPEPSTVATKVLLLLHVPPVEVLAKVVIDPTHTMPVPVIPVGTAFIVSVIVTTVQPSSIL